MLASGVGLVRVQWQESVRGMVRGFEKYGGSGGIGSIRAAVALATLAATCELAPWLAIALALAAGAIAPLIVGVATIGVAVVALLGFSGSVGTPRRGVLALPIGPVLVWWMQVRAGWLEHRRGGVVWRDTFYASEDLRASKRYRLPGFN